MARDRRLRQDVRQHGGRDLAAAAAAVAELGQADEFGRSVHIGSRAGRIGPAVCQRKHAQVKFPDSRARRRDRPLRRGDRRALAVGVRRGPRPAARRTSRCSTTRSARAIGTIYKQVSPFESKKLGAALVSRNIARHLEESFARRDKSWRPLVYCWRGGKRSGAMTHVLREIGWQAAQLEGGYKAYRREVVAQLATQPREFRYLVVCGETGSAKSRLLASARRRRRAGARPRAARGAPRLGARQPARARRSLRRRCSRPACWDGLRRLDPHRPVFVEAESKKIGQLQVPDALLETMRAAECIRVEAPVEARVQFLIDEYRHFLGRSGGA